MALPQKPIQSNEDSAPKINIPSFDEAVLPSTSIKSQGLPTSPNERLTRDLDIEHAAAGLQDIDEERSRYREMLEGNVLDLKEYVPIGTITSEEVLKNDYHETYAKYEEIVVETKRWLQDLLQEQDRIKDLAEARKTRRSKAFNDMKTLLDQLLLRYFETEKRLPQRDLSIVISLISNEVLGLGPIEPLWSNPKITEVMVNGPSKVYVEIEGRVQLANGVKFRNQDHLLETIQQILAPLNKSLDIAHPFVDGRLTDGSRLNATHTVIGPGGPYLTIRRFPETIFSIRTMLELGAISEEMVVDLANKIYYGCSTLISGGTGTGKTSALNAFTGAIPDYERIITIEDNLELRPHPRRHVVAMEARQSRTKDGEGTVSIRDLVKNSLRQRPERIVVGEVRDSTALDLVNALSTGHEGSLATVHANNAAATIERMVGLILQAGELDNLQALSMLGFSIDIIVSLKRYSDGSRRVAEIAEVPTQPKVDRESNKATLKPNIIWRFIEDNIDVVTGKVSGSFVKVGDWSEELIEIKALNLKKVLTIEEILEMSDQQV